MTQVQGPALCLTGPHTAGFGLGPLIPQWHHCVRELSIFSLQFKGQRDRGLLQEQFIPFEDRCQKATTNGGTVTASNIYIDVASGVPATEIQAPGSQWGDKVPEDLALHGKRGRSLDF